MMKATLASVVVLLLVVGFYAVSFLDESPDSGAPAEKAVAGSRDDGRETRDTPLALASPEESAPAQIRGVEDRQPPILGVAFDSKTLSPLGGIAIVFTSATGEAKTAVTDAAGRFSVSGLEPGDYFVTCDATGFFLGPTVVRLEETDVGVVTPTSVGGESARFASDHVELFMEPGVLIEGLTEDAETGAPVVGVLVLAYRTTGSGGSISSVRSDSAGRFLMVLPSDLGIAYITTDHPEYVSLREEELDLKDSEEGGTFVLSLHGGGRFRGRVLEQERGHVQARSVATGEQRVVELKGEDFEFPLLLPGEYDVEVVSPDAGMISDRVEIISREETYREYTLPEKPPPETAASDPPAVEPTVLVRIAPRDRLSGVSVEEFVCHWSYNLEPSSERPWYPSDFSRTRRSEGEPLLLQLNAASYIFRIEAEGYADLVTEVTVEASSTEQNVELPLAPAETLLGTIVDATTGEELAGATLVALDRVAFHELAVRDLTAGRYPASQTKSDSEGRFELPSFSPAVQRLLAYRPGYLIALMDSVESPDELVIRLEPADSVDLRYRRFDGTRPGVGIFRVRYDVQNVRLEQSVSCAAPGDTSVMLLRHGPAAVQYVRTVARTLAPVFAETVEFGGEKTFELARVRGEALLRGKVVGSDGRGIEGVSVSVSTKVLRRDITNAEGTFVIPDLTRGGVTVFVHRFFADQVATEFHKRIDVRLEAGENDLVIEAD